MVILIDGLAATWTDEAISQSAKLDGGRGSSELGCLETGMRITTGQPARNFAQTVPGEQRSAADKNKLRAQGTPRFLFL